MSTTIDIYPVSNIIPTFSEVIDVCNKNIKHFFEVHKINLEIVLNVNLHDNKEKYVKDNISNDLFKMKENEYAWFYSENYSGGTDCYFETIDDDFQSYLKEDLLNSKYIDKLNIILDNGYFWYFRKSEGQPIIIDLLYKLLSLSIAELTNGIICSDDTWDNYNFPCSEHEFKLLYFNNKEKYFSDDFKDFIEMIKKFQKNCAH